MERLVKTTPLTVSLLSLMSVVTVAHAQALGQVGQCNAQVMSVVGPDTVQAGKDWQVDASYQLAHTGWRVFSGVSCYWRIRLLYDNNKAHCVSANGCEASGIESWPRRLFERPVSGGSRGVVATFVLRWDVIGVQNPVVQLDLNKSGLPSKTVPVTVTKPPPF